MIKETIERQTLNGTQWQIVAGQYGVTLYMNDKFSGYSFRTIAEANAHLDAIDERLRAPRHFTPCEVPTGYYGD